MAPCDAETSQRSRYGSARKVMLIAATDAAHKSHYSALCSLEGKIKWTGVLHDRTLHEDAS